MFGMLGSSRWLRAIVISIAALAGVIAEGSPARSLSLAALSLAELDAAADVVVRGHCIDRTPTHSSGRIESVARFRVVEKLRGEAGEVVEVRQWGGEIGDRATVAPGAPLSQPGDDAVLFLAAEPDGTYRVVGTELPYEVKQGFVTKKETLTIKKLTADELIVVDPEGLKEEFSRVKKDEKKKEEKK